MPSYTVRDPDSGRTITISGDSPPTQAELEQLFSSLPKTAPSAADRPPVPELTNQPRSIADTSGLTELAYKARNSELGKAAFGPGKASGLQGSGFMPGVARYGLPVAAGLATAPLTAGMSVPAAIATTSGVGAGFSALGSTLAQLMEVEAGERSQMSGKEIASETVLGATPMKTTGGAAGRILANVPSALASSEISRWLELGDEGYSIKPKNMGEAVQRYALPVGITGSLSAVGGKAGAIAAKGAESQAIRQARFGGGVTLSDVFPNASKLEATQLARGSTIANDALQSIDVNIAQEVARAFPSAQNDAGLASDLFKHVNSLGRLQDDAVKASEAAQQAALLAQDAKLKLGAEMPALEAKASEAALEFAKRKLIYRTSVSTLFGGEVPDIGAIAQGRRMENMAELAKAAKDATKSAIGELYAKAEVGPNAPVASLDSVMARINALSGKGQPLEGNKARGAVVDAITKVFPVASEAGTIPTITLEEYRGLRDKIAANLAKEGEDPKAANRIAGAAYDAVRGASDDFIASTRPDIIDAWRTAQAAAAGEFKARETNAVGMLAEGKANELYEKILNEGAGPVLAELDAYRGVLASTFDRTNPASEAAAVKSASLFKDGVNKLLRDAAIDRAVDRGAPLDKTLRTVDLPKLVQELQTLSSKGFDINQLGLGSQKDIQQLSRLAASAKNGGYTVEEFDRILRDMPLGINASVARVDYERAVKAEMMASGVNAREDAVKRLSEAAGKARLDADGVRAVYERAAKDPLVQLLNRTDMKLSRDVVDNIKWVDRLLTVGPEAAADFSEAMTKSGRGGEMDKIKASAVATVMRRFSPVGDGPQRLNLQRISDFFFSQNKEAEMGRETLRSIMGSAEYSNLVGTYAKPIKDILATQRLLGQSDEAVRSLIDPNIVRVKTNVGGAGMINIPVVREMITMSQAGRYKTLYTLYVDPKWAPKFAAAGRNVDKFVASSPVNAAVLKLAMDEDEANMARR